MFCLLNPPAVAVRELFLLCCVELELGSGTAAVFHLEVIWAVAVDEHICLAELVKYLGIFWDGRCCRNAGICPDAEIHLRDGMMFSGCLIGL